MYKYNTIQIKKELCNQGYNVEKIIVSPLGTSKNSLFVYLNGEKHVLKLYESKDAKRVQWIINILHKINKKKKITIEPLNSKTLHFSGGCGFIYKYINWKDFEHAQVPDRLREFGCIVGEFTKYSESV